MTGFADVDRALTALAECDAEITRAREYSPAKFGELMWFADSTVEREYILEELGIALAEAILSLVRRFKQ